MPLSLRSISDNLNIFSRMERRVAELCSIEDSLKRDLQMQTDAFSRVNSQLSEVEALNIRLQASAPMEYTEAKERVLQLELNLSSAESEKRKLRSVISVSNILLYQKSLLIFILFEGPSRKR